MTIAGQGFSAMSQASQAGYEARVAGQNARLEAERAKDALERGREEKRRYGLQVRGEMGRQNAALAANNIDLTFGSAADVRADMARAGAEDIATLDRNMLRETRGYEINALNFRTEAVAARRRRAASYVSGAFGIAQTALGAASQYTDIRSRLGKGK